MPRPAKFTEDQILDAALHLAAEGGPSGTTVTGIAALLDAPVGSIYYRFKSRDLILARLWVRTIKRFQRGFLEALADEDLEAAALGAALHIIRWEREYVDEARVLLFFRREELAAQWPDELGEELATLNTGVEGAMRDYARRRYGEADGTGLSRVIFAIVDAPYAASRRYLLTRTPPPPVVDELVAATCRCILSSDAGE